MLAVLIAAGIRHRGAMMASIKLMVYVFNCMGIPFCLVGVGLAAVALVAHRDRDHRFTVSGLIVNGIVIFCVLVLFLLRVVPD
jgi:hypothetical protein